MKELPCISLGCLPAAKTGIYPHVNDRYLTRFIVAAINRKVAIWKGKRLSAKVSMADIVGEMTGYLHTTNAAGVAGYCDYTNGIIAIPDGSNLPTVCHEICHAIQAELGVFDKGGDLLSWQVKMEHQCETMAYYLHRAIFPDIPVSYDQFNSYFDKDSQLWLHQWYRGFVENDMFEP